MNLCQKIIKKYNAIPLSARASLWFLFANIFQKAVMVIFTPVFTRILTAEEFSRYAVFQSWETILTVFATLNISNYATSKGLVEYKDDRNVFISSAQSLTATLTIFTFGIFMLIKSAFTELDEFPLWMMALLFFDVVSVAFFAFWSQLERFNQKYRTLTIVSIVMGIASPLIAFLLIVFFDEINLYKGWARILGLVISNGLVAVLIFVICYNRSKVLFSTKYWKFCILYCLPLIPHFLSTAFLQKIGQLFVDKYCGSEMSGIYALANSLAMLMMVVNDALTKTLVPWTYEKLSEKKYKDINRPIILSLALIAIIDIIMALTAPELVAIFADSSYAEAIYAIPPLVAVCFFGFLYNTFANIEYYYKETKMVSMASIIAGIVIVVANILLVPRFGFIAAAYSSLISYVVYALMHYLFMKKTLKKHMNGLEVYNNKLIFRMAVGFIAIILCTNVLYKCIILRYGIIVLCCIIAIVKRKYIFNILNNLFVKREKKNVEQ